MNKTIFTGFIIGITIAAVGLMTMATSQPQLVNAQINCQSAVEETHYGRVFLIEYCDDGAFVTDTEDGSRAFVNARNCSIAGDERIILSSCPP
jgi:hypothetical protein